MKNHKWVLEFTFWQTGDDPHRNELIRKRLEFETKAEMNRVLGQWKQKVYVESVRKSKVTTEVVR